MDTGQGVVPGDEGLPASTGELVELPECCVLLVLTRSLSSVAWLKGGDQLFYAFHCCKCLSARVIYQLYHFDADGGCADRPKQTIAQAQERGKQWKMPTLLTEFGGYGSGCNVQGNATAAGVGSAYWHYSDYCWPKHCPGGAGDGHCPLTEPHWGACITGWGNGDANWKCH